jgi:hypothetical protein
VVDLNEEVFEENVCEEVGNENEVFVGDELGEEGVEVEGELDAAESVVAEEGADGEGLDQIG